MTLGEMITRFRILVPKAKLSVIDDPQVTVLLNEGVNKVNLLSKVFFKAEGTQFTATIGKQIYKFSVKVPTYLGMAKGGIWITNANGTYDRVIPKSREWFDDHFVNWWDAANAEPQHFFIEGDDITFNVPFSAERTVRVYHLQKATKMDNNGNYPWNNLTVEVTALEPLDNTIIAYAVWQVQAALGKDGNFAQKGNEFMIEQRNATKQVKRRPDFVSDHSAGMIFR